ncbi:MAG TPA: Hpt domain-containing response regulator [Xylella fastidiosa subsp. multiplex]
MTESPNHLHPRLLLVEDDPISRRFLQTSLQTLPAHVDWADSSTSALTLSRHHHHHLWLIDLNLPDGGGTELLSSLRRLHPNTPALAHTAEANLQLPHDTGFLAVLPKPLSSKRLLEAVRHALSNAPVGNDPSPSISTYSDQNWDEAAGLAALNGQHNHLDAMRKLFLAELPKNCTAIETALHHNDAQTLCAHLHRLQASCGFVGASRLSNATRRLKENPNSQQARAHFHEAIKDLLR